jgi:cytosine/creatinine deaminase
MDRTVCRRKPLDTAGDGRNIGAPLSGGRRMDLLLRKARLAGRESEGAFDVGIEHGRIAVIGKNLGADGTEQDLQGRPLAPGFVETHIHLDKSCILDRCRADSGDLTEAIAEVAHAK